MKRLHFLSVCLLLAGLGTLIPAFAKAPVELKQVAPVGDLITEAEEQVESIETASETEEKYADNKDDIRRSAGVLAVLAQGIAEHPESKSQKVSPVALREAAFQLVGSQNHKDVTAALGKVRSAMKGEAAEPKSDPVEWKDLIDMDDMMHVINTRNSRIVRAARRSRDPEGDSRHATTIAVLTLAMAEQTDHLATDEEAQAWKKYALDFQKGMTNLASAFKAEDKAGVRKHLDFATKACNDCHAQFRDEVVE